LTARPDLNRLPAAERVCWLLDAAEFILEMALMTNEAARVRIDTWAKLLYGERMLRASAPVLMLQANSAAAERRHHEIVASEVLGLPDALVAYCRADRLIKGHNLMQGPAIKEDQSIALSAALRLSQATQVELAQILEYLFLSLDEDPVSSTCLSDPLVWLEGTVHSAQSVFNHPRDGDALSGPELILLGRYLAQATALSRLNHLLTTRQQSKIRHWAAELFSS
jgi:hypothetical protein